MHSSESLEEPVVSAWELISQLAAKGGTITIKV